MTLVPTQPFILMDTRFSQRMDGSKAVQILQDMEDVAVTPDVAWLIAWRARSASAAITGSLYKFGLLFLIVGACGTTTVTLYLLHDGGLLRAGVVLNSLAQVMTYNTVMSSCEKGRDYDAAQRVMSEMQRWAACLV